MEKEIGDINALIDEKVELDTDFQESIAELEDEEKEQKIELKKAEIIKEQYSTLHEDLKKKEELANNYKIRAEKAEEKAVSKKKEETTDLSSTDLYALMGAKVPQEDVDEVVKASKLLGKSIQEALQDTTVKTILETRQEERNTAVASNTDLARPSSLEVSGAEVLKKTMNGDVPEKGSKEAEALYWERRGGKR